MDIGRQLRNLIEEDGITQKHLAETLNISTTTLNGYIQNRRQPDAKIWRYALPHILALLQIIFTALPRSGSRRLRLLTRRRSI